MGMPVQEQRQYFDFVNCPIDSNALCAANLFHSQMDKLGISQNRLITWNGVPQMVSSLDMSLIPYQGGSYLQEALAKYTADYMRRQRYLLPVGVEKKWAVSLLDGYFLKSCLVYGEYTSRSGVKVRLLVTKSAGVLHALRSRSAPSELRKTPERFAEQTELSYNELESGIFQAVSVIPEADGYHFKKVKINTRNKGFLVPYYSLLNWGFALGAHLASRQSVLSYTVEGLETEVLTSLEPEVLAKWMGTYPQDAVASLSRSWRSSLLAGEVTVPNLQSPGQFVTVPVLGVQRVEALPASR
jgi:hypothetical protein